MTDRELMQMSFGIITDYINDYGPHYKSSGAHFVMDALRDRLAQPERVLTNDISQERVDETAKRKHEWVGLDIDEIYDMSQKIKQFCTNDLDQMSLDKYAGAFAVAIEAKLKEKNT